VEEIIQIKGDHTMDYKLENIDVELVIVGKGYEVKTNEAFQMIPSLWEYAKKDGLMQKLIDLSWEQPKCKLEGLLGVCGTTSAITDEKFTYFMGIRYDKEVPNDMQRITITHDTWAVIPNVDEAWKRLHSEWLSASRYELAHVPLIECYYPPNHHPENELWIPIKQK
jgi:AraC family transcriptional regulator